MSELEFVLMYVVMLVVMMGMVIWIVKDVLKMEKEERVKLLEEVRVLMGGNEKNVEGGGEVLTVLSGVEEKEVESKVESVFEKMMRENGRVVCGVCCGDIESVVGVGVGKEEGEFVCVRCTLRMVGKKEKKENEEYGKCDLCGEWNVVEDKVCVRCDVRRMEDEGEA